MSENNYTTPSDNTRVHTFIPKQFLMTPERKERFKQSLLQKRIPSLVYDLDKYNYYKALLNFYNTNFFGYGIAGKQTKFNPATPEGLQAIQANMDYAKDNVKNLSTHFLGSYLNGLFKGLVPIASTKMTVGKLSHLTPYKIGQGAEALVINNSPTSVAKIMLSSVEDILKRNAIPNTVKNKFAGFIKDGTLKFPTFLQKKVKVLNEKTFPKYIDKLDNAMLKSGFKRVNDPNVQYRAYTDGNVVIDDIAPGNVGLNLFRKPKIIDFNMQSIPEWIEQGFTLKRGGKLSL